MSKKQQLPNGEQPPVTRNIHDTYFKELFGNLHNVRTFLDEFYPELSACLELSRIDARPTEKFPDKAKGSHYLDLAINCTIKGQSGKLYFIFEHKSYPDKKIIIQLVRYILAVWEEDASTGKPLTPIIPFVFYNGERPWNVLSSTQEAFSKLPQAIQEYMQIIRYILFDTKTLKDEHLARLMERNRLLMIGLDALRLKSHGGALNEVVSVVLELADLMHTAGFQDNTVLEMFLEKTIEYVQGVGNLDAESIDALLCSEEDTMQSVVQYWRKQGFEQGIEKGFVRGLEEGKEQGIQQGIEKGIEQGIEKGIEQGIEQGVERGIEQGFREMVLATIEARLGTIPDYARTAIVSITDTAYLRELNQKIIKAQDPEALLLIELKHNP